MGGRLHRAFRDDRGAPAGDVALRLFSRVSHRSFGSRTFLPDVLPGCHVVGTGAVLYRGSRRPGNRGGSGGRRHQRNSTLRCRRRSEKCKSSIGGLRGSRGEQRRLCLVLYGGLPGLSSRFQVGLEIWILVQILVQWIASQKWVIADTEFTCSADPAKCLVVLMRNGQFFCDVDTIPGVRPVHALLPAEPRGNRDGPPC